MLSDNISFNIRIIPYQKFTGTENMALDRYFSHICSMKSDAVLRFFGWTPYCVSIGRHQSMQILNIDGIKSAGYDYVKRPTGGRAIFHADELTYSFIVPRYIIDHRTIYVFIHNILTAALRNLGYSVSMEKGRNILPRIRQNAVDFPCFTRSAFSEIQFNGKKVVGSAQRLYPNSVLQHGSILIGSEHEKICDFLVGKPWQFAKIREEIKNNTISLNQITSKTITPAELEASVIKQLELRDNISLNSKNVSKSELNKSILYQM